MRELTVKECETVLVVTITPRDSAGNLDISGIRANCEFLLKRGIQCIMPMCGTGLVYDATLAEYEECIATVVETVGDKATVVPGIGPGFGHSLEMGHIAKSVGVSGVMIMPIVGPASAKGVHIGMQRIIERVNLPVVIYQRRLDIMPTKQIVGLCKLDGVVGLKYAVDDIGIFDRIVEQVNSDAALLCGMAEDPALEYLKAGAVGYSSGMANFVPETSLAMLNRFRSGDLNGAEEIRSTLVPFEDFRGEKQARYSGSALHSAMNYAGLAAGPVVPFAEEVSDEDLPRLQEMLSKILRLEQSFVTERTG